MKPEAAQEEDTILIPVGESEEEMTPVTREETITCQEMEARQEEEEEPTSVDMKPEAARQEEVPVEDTTVIPVGEPEEEMTSITREEGTMACQETRGTSRRKRADLSGNET
jgi:pyruvate kinase